MLARRSVIGLGLLLVGLASAGLAADDRPRDKPKAERKVIESKAQKHQPATAVAFASAFDLPFESLLTLGERIEQARRAADPVGLGLAAKELALAEQVSGKKASLTSAALMKEAAALAKARQSAAELKAVCLLHDGESNEDTKKELETAAAKAGERPRGVVGMLEVRNDDPGHDVWIYINGALQRPLLRRNTARLFTLADLDRTTALRAVSFDQTRQWSQDVTDNRSEHIWVLTRD